MNPTRRQWNGEIGLGDVIALYDKENDIEELADIIEVVEALAIAQGSSLNEIMMIKEAKANKNGRFEKRYFLESVIK